MRARQIAALALCALAIWPAAPATAQQLASAELVWPLPPEPSRIRYVGSVTADVDLGKKPSLFGRITRALVGGQPDAITMVRPTDVYAVDSTRLYVTDSALGKLLVFDSGKKEVEQLGETGPGALVKPMGLGGDRLGRVYVTDPANRRVVVFGPTGEFIRAFGGRSVLLNPVDVAVDPESGRVYVADSYLHQVVVFDVKTGALVGRIGKHVGDLATKDAEDQRPQEHRLWHGPGTGRRAGPRDLLENRGGRPGEFLYPVSVSVALDGTLFVSDGLNFRVQAFDDEGRFLRQFGKLGDTPGSFARPKGISVDREGHVYVVDAAFNNLQVFDPMGRLLITFGRGGVGAGELVLPLGVHIDRNDRIYVADRYNGRIQLFQYLSRRPDIVVEASGGGSQ